MADKHTGTCFCGSVKIEVTGAPETMGYCYCAACRAWSAGPVNAFTLWKPETVKVAKGMKFLGLFKKADNSYRRFCRKCGGHILTDHPDIGLTDVHATTIPTVAFKPNTRVNCAESIRRMKEGLPKLKDFPAALNGTGEALPE